MRILIAIIGALACQKALAATITVNPGDSLQEAIDGSESSDTILIRSSDVFTENLTLTDSRHFLVADGFVPVLTSESNAAVISTIGSGYEPIEISINGLFLETGSADYLFDLADNTAVRIEDTFLEGEVFYPLVDTSTPDVLPISSQMATGTVTVGLDSVHAVELDENELSENQRAIITFSGKLKEIIDKRGTDGVPDSLQQSLRLIQAASADRLHAQQKNGSFSVFDYLAIAAFRINKLAYSPDESEGLTEELDLLTQELSGVARNISEVSVLESDEEDAMELFENANDQLAKGWHYEALREYGQAWRLSL